ncbi:hypothetical protein E2320_002457, partial [Naja naja]
MLRKNDYRKIEVFRVPLENTVEVESLCRAISGLEGRRSGCWPFQRQLERRSGRAAMAGPYESSPVIVTVTYGNEKHNLQVDSQEDSQPTVHDLALLTEQVTGVPVSFQKLIYKGKSLKEMEQPLSTLGVKNGCKVMLIGKRNSPEEETELKKLKVLEKSVEQLAKKIDEVNKDLREIQKDFLAKNNQTEALSQLDKRIKGTAEQFMKILEQIDAIDEDNLEKNS